MKSNTEDIFWIIDRIQFCVERAKTSTWKSSKRYIYQGSYDVWESPNDEQMYNVIKNSRLQESKDLGLIINQSGKGDWHYNEDWKLTDLGETILNFMKEFRSLISHRQEFDVDDFKETIELFNYLSEDLKTTLHNLLCAMKEFRIATRAMLDGRFSNEEIRIAILWLNSLTESQKTTLHGLFDAKDWGLIRDFAMDTGGTSLCGDMVIRV